MKFKASIFDFDGVLFNSERIHLHGIRICNLAPAKIMTPMLIVTNLDNSQIIPAEDLAKAALWMYQQPQTICVRDLVFAPTYYEP